MNWDRTRCKCNLSGRNVVLRDGQFRRVCRQNRRYIKVDRANHRAAKRVVFQRRRTQKINTRGIPITSFWVPRAASFAEFTLKVGRPTGQLYFPLEIRVIVDEFLDMMEMVNSGDIRALEERIPEPPYLRNFLGLAKRIAPDGERVQQVGFTVERGEQPRRTCQLRSRQQRFP